MNKREQRELIKQLLGPKRVKTEAGEVENRDAADIERALKLINRLQSSTDGGDGSGLPIRFLQRKYQ